MNQGGRGLISPKGFFALWIPEPGRDDFYVLLPSSLIKPVLRKKFKLGSTSKSSLPGLEKEGSGEGTELVEPLILSLFLDFFAA
jgi:hypothetical protein